MILKYKDTYPETDKSSYIASTAVITGRVKMFENSSVFFGVSARGDINFIQIGKNTNIQDNSVLHVANDHPCIIGDDCVIGHSAVIHGCSVANNVLVGIGAIILNGAKIGSGSIIAASSLVPEGTVIPENSLVMGVPAKVVRKTTTEEQKSIKELALKYVKVAAEYKTCDTENAS
jgi:carbonic anhydrase/acetyltransferase-like protein (isoleucine patch superfamily)